jgi:hypothetical protein
MTVKRRSPRNSPSTDNQPIPISNSQPHTISFLDPQSDTDSLSSVDSIPSPVVPVRTIIKPIPTGPPNGKRPIAPKVLVKIPVVKVKRRISPVLPDVPVVAVPNGKRRMRSASSSTLLRSSKRQHLAPGSPTHTTPFKVFDEGSKSPTTAATTRNAHGVEDLDAIRLGVKMLENPTYFGYLIGIGRQSLLLLRGHALFRMMIIVVRVCWVGFLFAVILVLGRFIYPVLKRDFRLIMCRLDLGIAIFVVENWYP